MSWISVRESVVNSVTTLYNNLLVLKNRFHLCVWCCLQETWAHTCIWWMLLWIHSKISWLFHFFILFFASIFISLETGFFLARWLICFTACIQISDFTIMHSRIKGDIRTVHSVSNIIHQASTVNELPPPSKLHLHTDTMAFLFLSSSIQDRL